MFVAIIDVLLLLWRVVLGVLVEFFFFFFFEKVLFKTGDINKYHNWEALFKNVGIPDFTLNISS